MPNNQAVDLQYFLVFCCGFTFNVFVLFTDKVVKNSQAVIARGMANEEKFLL